MSNGWPPPKAEVKEQAAADAAARPVEVRQADPLPAQAERRPSPTKAAK
jgi:hypothetical protein